MKLFLGDRSAFVLFPNLCLEFIKNGLFGEDKAIAIQITIQPFHQPEIYAMVSGY